MEQSGRQAAGHRMKGRQAQHTNRPQPFSHTTPGMSRVDHEKVGFRTCVPEVPVRDDKALKQHLSLLSK